MCNLSMGVFEEGFYKGRTEGRAEGKVAMIAELLKENFPLEKALKIAGIDRETYEKYKK